MRKLIVAGIAFIFLLGGFIVYMEIDKRKFIDNISAVSEVVDQPVNVLETTREVTQASEEPKFQEVDPDELLAAVNRVPEQFGYTEASITYAKLATKSMSGEKLTPDEKVAYMEASLYLWPNEYTRRSLILQKWVQSKGPNFPPRDGFSDEDIAELKDLGISVVYRGDAMIINPPHDYIRRDLDEEDAGAPASDTVFSEGIGEDTDFPQRRSEVSPVMSEPKISVTPEHVHQKDRHVHEPPPLSTRLCGRLLKTLKPTVGRDCRLNNESRRNSCLTSTAQRRGFVGCGSLTLRLPSNLSGIDGNHLSLPSQVKSPLRDSGHLKPI